MKKLFSKIRIKSVLIMLSLVLFGFMSVYIPHRVMAEPILSDAFKNPDYPLYVVKASYHDAMNAFFNTKFEILAQVLEEDEFYSDERFIVPEGVDAENYLEKCPEDNVSTFCVSMQALDIYKEYLDTLNLMKDQLISVEEQGPSPTLSNLLDLTSARNTNISDEIVEAEKVLMMTVSAYNEYRVAYPMHIENKKIIKTLIKYRRELIYARRWVELFPSRFIDATSAYCK